MSPAFPPCRSRLASPLATLCLLALGPSLATAGCKHTVTPTGCTQPYFGDPAQPMQLELYYLGEDYLPHDVIACGPIDIVPPPQGGEVLFVGVRAANFDPCNAAGDDTAYPSLTGVLRDPDNSDILGVDTRSTQFQALAGRAGWAQTSASGDATNGYAAVANIPVCPNSSSLTAPRDVQQQVGVLEIDLTDRNKKKGQVLVRVQPRCAQADDGKRAQCECECQAGYTMQKCQNVFTFPDPPDAGACYPADGGPSQDATFDLPTPQDG